MNVSNGASNRKRAFPPAAFHAPVEAYHTRLFQRRAMTSLHWSIGVGRFASLATVLLAAAAACSVAAQDGGGSALVRVTAQSSVATIHPDEKFLLAFTFDIDPLWHIYWANPGESGAPTTIEVKAPAGYTVHDIVWSRPSVIPGEPVTYGYEARAMLFVPIDAPATMTEGQVEFTASIGWMVCRDTCLLGSSTQALKVATTAEPLPARPRKEPKEGDAGDEAKEGARERGPARRFDDPALEATYREVIPVRLRRVKNASIEFNRDSMIITVTGPARGQESLQFLPNHSPGVSAAVKESVTEKKRFRLVLEVKVDEQNTLDKSPVAGGLILMGEKPDAPAYEFDVPLKQRS